MRGPPATALEDAAALVAALGEPERRRQAGRALARRLGAEDLLLFTLDPMLGRLLAAPELPQTLPEGRRWREFVEGCADAAASGRGVIQVAELAYPTAGERQRVTGLAAADRTVLALIGGAPEVAHLTELRHVLPLLGSIVRSEWRALTAAGRADLAEAGESRTRQLAAAVDAARQEAERALVRARRAEETAAARAAQLEALAEENARLHRQAQDAVRLRDAVLSAAAHDLKTPIAATKASAQLLRRRALRGVVTPEALRRGLDVIESGAGRMSAMVDELVDLARLQAGQPLALRREATDVVALAQRVLATHGEGQQRCALRLESEEEELVGEWDGPRLERALDNLIANSVKYSPGGEDVVVTIRSAGAGWAVVTVEDHGIGIPAADVPHIFDRFHRASNVTEEIVGTGIGLASAKQIVEQHGGTIAVESREGVGSKFTLRLPRRSDGPHAGARGESC